MSTYVDIHIIQNLPPSCVNRDDSGSPKSAVYGGVRRLRVSSQSWKRATRLYFNDLLDAKDVGVRTKRVVEVLGERIAEDAPELAGDAAGLAEKVFAAAKIKLSPPRGKKDAPQESGYLLFLSTSQIARLAGLAIASARGGEALDAKTARRSSRRRTPSTSRSSAAWSPTTPTSMSTPPARWPTPSPRTRRRTSTTSSPPSTMRRADQRKRTPALA